MAKILVVDDEQDILEILKDLFKSEGHEVDTFENALHAIERLTQNSFDLIISDIKMPVMNGVDFLKNCRSKVPNQYKNFVFITGFAEVSEKEAIELGADKFYSKPLDLEDFIKDINEMLV